MTILQIRDSRNFGCQPKKLHLLTRADFRPLRTRRAGQNAQRTHITTVNGLQTGFSLEKFCGGGGGIKLMLQAPKAGSAPGTPAWREGPSIFSAVQEQLGLKLESAKASLESLIIEHVERPSEN